MKIEHFALNVEDPLTMANWYIKHLGLTLVRQEKEAPFMTFITDDSGTIMFEIYKNSAVQVPDYRKMNPLLVHLAFVSKDSEQDKIRLMEAGASFDHERRFEDGSHMVMMRDPWGLAIQLWKRESPMLK